MLSFIMPVLQMHTDMFGWYWLQVIVFGIAHDMSSCVTHDQLLESAASMMNATCRTWPYLLSGTFVFSSLSLSLSLTFVLRYIGSGNTIVVFRLSLFLLSCKLSLYLVRILYFVVICILIRLHQSKKAHSTTWKALLLCKYEIISIFLCCNLQNMEYV